MNKLIVLDGGHFIHSAGFAWSATVRAKLGLKPATETEPAEEIPMDRARTCGIPPASFTCVRMIVSELSKIGLDKEDKVLLAMDGRNNWRKQFLDSYKGNRKHEEFWKYLWNEFDRYLNELAVGAGFIYLKIDQCESDDIAAVVAKYIKDKELVFVSADSDWEMLWHYDGVKLWSPHGSKHCYKIRPENFNVYELVSKKIYKEAKENMTTEVESQEELEKRNLLKNMLFLPDHIEMSIKTALEKELDKIRIPNIDLVPFRSIRENWNKIYNKDNVVTYEQTIASIERKKVRKAKKAERERIKKAKLIL